MGDLSEPDLLTRLSHHRTLGHAPASEHAWLAAHGTFRTFDRGGVEARKGEHATHLLIIFVGNLVIRVDRGAGSHKIFEARGGDVGGLLPYSRGAIAPNDIVAEEPTQVLAIAKELLPEMMRECPVVTSTLVHAMMDRARQFTSSDLHDEKLLSLGKLAAGLAHELNNPASAVMASAKRLALHLSDAERASRRLAAAQLSEAQLAVIDVMRSLCQPPGTPAALSPMARADREDAIADWLVDHGVGVEYSNALAGAGLTPAAFDTLATRIDGEALVAAIQSLAADSLLRALSSEIEAAASRIHGLVGAVKGFTYMDRSPTPEPVDIRRGIADTLVMLGAKTRAKAVEISIDLADDLPQAHAVGAELNQVWMNLIDNALDAVATGGCVNVTAMRELDSVVVRIIDDGPGVPQAIQGRIFDPFFTTKGVGEGTGLGLDIARRLLQRHGGGIAVESRPGRTEFQVRLPAES